MNYLIIILFITHLIVLYQLRSYIKAYKKNNHNYINRELQKINTSFSSGINTINQNIKTFSQNTLSDFDQLQKITNNFNYDQKKKFNELTSFIKADYKSYTELLKVNNDLLSILLEKTKENITENHKLKPLLQDSSQELEKVYGKIKQLISSYEKSLSDLKDEVENTLMAIEDNIDTKIKQVTAKGEKTISDSIEVGKDAIHNITEETNTKLKRVLKENQIKLLTDQVQSVEKIMKTNLLEINKTIENLDESFLNKLKTIKVSKDKKGFFGF
ncbi:hypothetical protein GTQ40_13435 [Flavobacteriaceae bacterium R38]|nr:hypothetical protein [Flavobacteriaceae bacterium R38]